MSEINWLAHKNSEKMILILSFYFILREEYVFSFFLSSLAFGLNKNLNPFFSFFPINDRDRENC